MERRLPMAAKDGNACFQHLSRRRSPGLLKTQQTVDKFESVRANENSHLTGGRSEKDEHGKRAKRAKRESEDQWHAHPAKPPGDGHGDPGRHQQGEQALRSSGRRKTEYGASGRRFNSHVRSGWRSDSRQSTKKAVGESFAVAKSSRQFHGRAGSACLRSWR